MGALVRDCDGKGVVERVGVGDGQWGPKLLFLLFVCGRVREVDLLGFELFLTTILVIVPEDSTTWIGYLAAFWKDGCWHSFPMWFLTRSAGTSLIIESMTTFSLTSDVQQLAHI